VRVASSAIAVRGDEPAFEIAVQRGEHCLRLDRAFGPERFLLELAAAKGWAQRLRDLSIEVISARDRVLPRRRHLHLPRVR
jgi:hypothetical protein